jgi:molybdopterin synthase catalytic subunit
MICVQSAPFDLGDIANRFAVAQAGAGAIVTFSGVVRGDGGLLALEIEHYPAMTLPAITDMVDGARARFGLLDAWVIHRYGRLNVGEMIMMVATSAPHRKDAFAGAEYLMDYLKSRAPFWKKEHHRDGAAWVAAKDSDEALLARWG